MVSRCRRLAAISRERWDTSRPTTCSIDDSLSKAPVSFPWPQPRSRTRRAPLAPTASITAAEALLVETERTFDDLFLGVVSLGQLVGVVVVILLQAGHRLPGQLGVVAQVAIGDELPVGVRAEPRAAAAEQLVHLVVADPIVLVVVEDGKKDKEVLQQVLDLLAAAQSDREVAAVAPGREFGVQGDGCGLHFIAEWLEEPAQHGLASPARHDGEADLEWDFALRQVGALLAPSTHRRGEHLAKATDMNDEVANGRSLTYWDREKSFPLGPR